MKVINGNNIDLLKQYPDNYFDAVVTDPPYGLGKEPIAEEVMKDWIQKGYHEISGSGFMGKNWDAFIPQPIFWKEVFRVLKHGGHVLSFFGTRTYDWGVMSMRFAGFEVRDCIQWVYGCLSDDTEILTENGWMEYRHFRKIKKGSILVYNIHNDEYFFEQPEKWNEYTVQDTCYRIESDSTQQIVSRNHRCLIEREGVLLFDIAENLAQERQATIPVLESMQHLQNAISNFHKRTGCKEFNLWSNMQWEENFQIQNRKEHNSYRKKENSNDLLLGLWQDLYKTFVLSEKISKTKTFVDNGMRTSHRPQSNEQQYYESDVVCIEQGTQTIRTRKSYSTTLATITPIKYNGLIFCPTVSTGAFVARRNGKIFLTGNSGFPKSHNISKAIDKMGGESLDWFIDYILEVAKEKGISKKELTMLFPSKNGNPTGWLWNKQNNQSITIEQYNKIKDYLKLPFENISEAKREVIGKKKAGLTKGQIANFKGEVEFDITAPATDAAKQWEGFGSALKPANEPIVLARKPLEKGLSIAENVLKWGTGGINIDGCRINTNGEKINIGFSGKILDEKKGWNNNNVERTDYDDSKGRFPSNLILTHHPDCELKGLKKVKGSRCENPSDCKTGSGAMGDSFKIIQGDRPPRGFGDENNEETIEHWECHEDCPIRIMDEQSGITPSNFRNTKANGSSSIWNSGDKSKSNNLVNDSGGSSRFFYCAKASKSERNNGLDGFDDKYSASAEFRPNHMEKAIEGDSGNPYGRWTPIKNFHPTVKPVKLMQYLIRLITPPNGIVLDPFCGSGTTGIACKLEGFDFVGMEQDAEYCKIAEARINNYQEEPEEPLEFIEEEDKPRVIQQTLF
jgi:DNA modification methylase